MRTFTEREIEYLLALKQRNFDSMFKKHTAPLSEPMKPQEEQLRERIGDKCTIYMQELGLAKIAGVLPNKKMKETGLNSIEQVLDAIEWGYLLI